MNWKEYNPRVDSKRPSWFRVEIDTVLGDKFFGLNCEFRWMWMFILAKTMKEWGDSFLWKSSYVEAMTGILAPTQDKILAHLIKMGCISMIDEEENKTDQVSRTTSQSNMKLPRELLRDSPARPDEIRLDKNINTRSANSEIAQCEEAWADALKKHGVGRDPLPGERDALARAIQRYGCDSVLLALLGAKYEPDGKDFKASRFVSLKRTLAFDGFERFVNLGSQAKTKIAVAAADLTKLVSDPLDEPRQPADPAKVQAIIARAMAGKGVV